MAHKIKSFYPKKESALSLHVASTCLSASPNAIHEPFSESKFSLQNAHVKPSQGGSLLCNLMESSEELENVLLGDFLVGPSKGTALFSYEPTLLPRSPNQLHVEGLGTRIIPPYYPHYVIS